MPGKHARAPWLFGPIVCLTALLLPVAVARAQVGSGWVQYSPPSAIHLDGSAGIESYPGTSTDLRNEGASFSDMGGIETFALHDPISNRSERRMQNTYQNGKHQFEGEVRVSPPTDDESIMQVFGGNSGATTQMIRAYNTGGGTLRKVPGSVVLAENVHGTWVKVNVIHDVGGNFVRTYINGKLLTTGDGEATNAGNDGWYHKYGCYGTLRTGSAKVEWRNVKHFRDGTPPTGDATPPPPPRDGGTAPDAASADTRTGDGGAAPDASGSGGTGGSSGSTGGSGGAGGSSSSGGASGTGGSSSSGGATGSGGTGTGGTSGGTGGRPPTAGRGGTGGGATPLPAPTTESGGCGCRLTPGAPTALPVLLLSFATLVFARRRRRR
jgi:MYXO-CTERM domain-containing protein